MIGQTNKTRMVMPSPDYQEFRNWVMKSKQGDSILYHTGNLALDRRRSEALCNIADLVSILNDTSYICAVQKRLQPDKPISYGAIRTGQGTCPRCLVLGKVSTTDYQILKILSDVTRRPDPRYSSIRAISRAIPGVPTEAVARRLMQNLLDKGLIQYLQTGDGVSGRGYELTTDGNLALV